MATTTLNQGTKICLKLVNNIQGRTDELIRQIDDAIDEDQTEDQTEQEEVKTVLETTKECLTFILGNLDRLENIIQSSDGAGDIDGPTSFEAEEGDIFTAEVLQLFVDHIPKLYETIQEFIGDQPDNICDVRYMVQEKGGFSGEQRDAAIDVIEIIEAYFDRMEDFYTVNDEDDVEENDQCGTQESKYSDLRSYDEDVDEDVDNEDDDNDEARDDDSEVDSLYDTWNSLPNSSYGDLGPLYSPNDEKVPHSYPLPDSPFSGRDSDSVSGENFTTPTKRDGTPDMRHKVNKENFPHLLNDKQKQQPKLHLKKDGTPDLRFKENKTYKPILLKKGERSGHIKKDGTPDRRYKENKEITQKLSSAYSSRAHNNSSGPLKKNGTPDMRYSANKHPQTPTPLKNASTGPLKKNGTPDMRYAANKSSASGPLKTNGTPDMRYAANKSSASGPLKTNGTPDMRYAANKSTTSSVSYATPGPLKKNGTPDMRYAANKSASSGSRKSNYSGASTSSYYSSGGSYAASGSSYRSGGSSYSAASSSSYCPGPTTKSGAPDMRYSVNKAYYK